MTDTNRSLSELPALIAERRRYESWLVALDARRETTPAHVFERVQADYQTVWRGSSSSSRRTATSSTRSGPACSRALSLLEAEEQHAARRARRVGAARARRRVGRGRRARSRSRRSTSRSARSSERSRDCRRGVDELEALLDQRYTPPAPRASGKTVNADVGRRSARTRTHARRRRTLAAAGPRPQLPTCARAAPEPAKAGTAPDARAPAPEAGTSDRQKLVRRARVSQHGCWAGQRFRSLVAQSRRMPRSFGMSVPRNRCSPARPIQRR